MGIASMLKTLFSSKSPDISVTVTHYKESNQNSYKKILESDYPDEVLKNLSGHNMSMNPYKVVAVYIPTNRRRTIQTYGFSEQDAIAHIGSDYNLPPVNIEKAEYSKPSREQISYMVSLGIKIPNKCCKEDASALISMKQNDFKNASYASAELKEFANSKRISYSLYLNEPHLLNRIYKCAESPTEQVALMTAAMYREMNGRWDFFFWDKWLEFGQKACGDKSFMNSFKRNADEWGEFFGFGNYRNSASDKTVLYQTIRNYLKYQ